MVDETTIAKFSGIIVEQPKQTISQLAREAIDIQHASNIRGISKSFVKLVDELCELIAEDVEANPISLTRRENIQWHPIVQMWASKIHDLTGMGLSDLDAFHEAYEWCKREAVREG
jgi:hypothetical protein